MLRLISAYCPFLIHFWILTSILLPQFGWKKSCSFHMMHSMYPVFLPAWKTQSIQHFIEQLQTRSPWGWASNHQHCESAQRNVLLHTILSFLFCCLMGTWAAFRIWLGTIVNQNLVAPNTCSVVLCGIKFFYQYTLQRDLGILDLVRPEREKKLPVVFSMSEVRQLLGCLRSPHYSLFVCLYACIWWGLLLQSFWINTCFVGIPGALLRLFSK